ncbi:hypothetical protein MASR1M31_05800 [Porphyromonadaceae bacterium]
MNYREANKIMIVDIKKKYPTLIVPIMIHRLYSFIWNRKAAFSHPLIESATMTESHIDWAVNTKYINPSSAIPVPCIIIVFMNPKNVLYEQQ